jgi:hypothetical protein
MLLYCSYNESSAYCIVLGSWSRKTEPQLDMTPTPMALALTLMFNSTSTSLQKKKILDKTVGHSTLQIKKY